MTTSASNRKIAPLLVMALASAVQAQSLGSAFTYQGQLKESGLPASGLYDFQACLFDGLVAAAPLVCAPDSADVPVAQGLFAVELDFGAAPFSGQQRYLELRARPGASSGTYTVLSPRQLLRATPEALRANTVPWTGLSAVPTGFSDGVDNVGITSISGGAGLSGGTITTSGTLAIATGGVNNAMVATNAIDSARILDDSVGEADIGSNAVAAAELADGAVDTAAIVDANVTSAKIAPGAIGSAQINTTQVQARITGSCGDGEYFRGINGDGTLDCELLPVAFNRVPDATGNVGSFVAVALRADQRPLIAYYDATNTSLKLYDCADAACASGTRRNVDNSSDVGANVAIAIRPNGLPVIAYRSVNLDSLRFYDCSNLACTTGTARTLDNTVTVGSALALALHADGRPFLAYRDDTNFRLRVYECDNLACSTGAAFAHPGTDVPYSISIAMRSDGRPLMALGGNAGSGARVRTYDCNDTGCTSGTLRNLTAVTFSGSVTMAIRGNGRPLITSSGQASTLSVHDCADALCVASTPASFTSNTTSAVGMTLRGDGRAVIAFGANVAAGVSDLRVLDCTDSNCTAGSSRTVVGSGDYGTAAAIALRSDGRPVLAFYDGTNDDLRLHICANPECT